jgi:hypothetical protein
MTALPSRFLAAMIGGPEDEGDTMRALAAIFTLALALSSTAFLA